MTLPFNSSLRLTTFDISAALQLRLLPPGSSPFCRHCGATSTLLHGEVCVNQVSWAVNRREGIKKSDWSSPDHPEQCLRNPGAFLWRCPALISKERHQTHWVRSQWFG